MTAILPPADFRSAKIVTRAVPAGSEYGRIFMRRYPNPLGFGKTPSRFSDPRPIPEPDRFGVLYLGQSVKVCFLEALLRDRRDGTFSGLPISERELYERNYARLVVDVPVTLVDLFGDGGVVMGVPSDVARSSRQDLARAWSVAFHEHPDNVDGIIYPSRLNGDTNIALFDRAITKLKPAETVPLVKAVGLADVLDDLRISLVP